VGWDKKQEEGLIMPHSLTEIWIHTVWSTKNRAPFLKGEFKAELILHIRQTIETMDCPVRIVNGPADHLHALFSLNPERPLADVLQMAKGESAHWVNQRQFLRVKFAWQTGYGGFSVSPSMIAKVEAYIRRQEEHHKKMTFQEEYERLIRMSGIPDTDKPKASAVG
jgi:putative transposase